MSKDSAPPWTPLLTGEAAERATAVIDAIAADLRQTVDRNVSEPQTWTRSGPSLAGGDAGQAFFFSYLDQARPGAGWDDTAMTLLERATERTGEMQAPPGLYSGFSGVAWTLEHLRGRLFEDDAEEDPGEEVAAAMIDHLALSPWRGHYDLISGLAGLGVYALERLPRTGGRECVERCVARLGEIAERGPDGITWHTGTELMIQRDIDMFPQGNYNLGVAHGLPGVIPILAGACAAGVAEAEARELLDGAVAWLLAHKLPAGMGSTFGYNHAPGAEPVPSRLAWCYGDLGIAASLLTAARAVGEEAWEREAIAIARKAAARPVEEAAVRDAGICHGAAGAAHLFNRIHQATGDEACRDAALLWLESTLAFHQPGKGVGGYLMWIASVGDDLDWRPDPGFLTGSAGVALALLAATTTVTPEWDRVLLTDISPKKT
jgi:lantibiotic modifying enzyme